MSDRKVFLVHKFSLFLVYFNLVQILTKVGKFFFNSIIKKI
ncbi:MAG: hypothetical protein CH6_1955 [Candidatus Kapaibacterium sp.]|nr:MAG: hypothetical protein CH6_1955 [Candidatus Kapabacteria bacterium]